MRSPDTRLLVLAALLLASLLVAIPWADGGRSPVGQAVLLLLAFLAGAVGSLGPAGAPVVRPSRLLVLTLLLVGISGSHSIYPDRTVQAVLLLAAYLVAGMLAIRVAREVPWGEGVLLASVATSGVLSAGWGMIRLLRDGEVGIYARLLTGPFGYPNAMAGYLLLAGGAAAAIAGHGASRPVRAAGTAAALLSAVGIALTGSRGAILAGSLGVLGWAVFRFQSRVSRWRLCLPAGMLLLLVLVGLQWSAIGSPLLRALGLPAEHAPDSSTLWRWQILRWTWAMVRDHPWWGVGPGAFPVALNQYQRLPYVSGENPHNLYLEVAAEYGLPVALVLLVCLVILMLRGVGVIGRSPGADPHRLRLTVLLATLAAFLVHSAVDLDWSFPAIATAGAVMLGLAAARLSCQNPPPVRPTPIWRGVLLLLLAVCAILALSRYYAATLVAWGRFALETGQTAEAERELTWALRLNPWSLAARTWMAKTLLQSGKVEEALDLAEGAVRIAPADANSRYLVGDLAAAAGRWEAAQGWFQSAVDRAPFSQLRFHAGVVESAARAGRHRETLRAYERAVASFSPERVLDLEARCLAPGDRYLLARMTRIAAWAHGRAGDRPVPSGLLEQAQILSSPDPRGICVSDGPSGRSSPEAAAKSFWHALSAGGWRSAAAFLAPDMQGTGPGELAQWGQPEGRYPRVRLLGVDSLSGGERSVSLMLDLERELEDGRLILQCIGMGLRLEEEGWLIEHFRGLNPGACSRWK